MVQNVKQISENRFRETFGRYYEEFNVGDIYEHRPGRTPDVLIRAIASRATLG